MKAPSLHRFNVEDFYRMGESEIFAPDSRVELLDGEIFDAPPSTPFHSGVIVRLNHLFLGGKSGRWIVSVRNPVRLDGYSETLADLALLNPKPDYYVSHHPEPGDVFLLIEVADCSLEFDHGKKLPICARAGIRELWIINLKDLAVEVYREPHFTGYEKTAVFNPGDQISPAAFPDIKLDVAELLRR